MLHDANSLPALARIALPAFLAWIVGVTGCASRTPNYQDPCSVMRAQIEEKQDLDARVKAVAKQAEASRKQGDTAAALSADQRLKGLLENQRLLKESLEQSGRDCSPTWQDPVPVRDPARREQLENPMK